MILRRLQTEIMVGSNLETEKERETTTSYIFLLRKNKKRSKTAFATLPPLMQLLPEVVEPDW